MPQQDLADAVRLWRFAAAMGGAAAGLAGVAGVFLLLLIHLSDLSSLGRSYLDPMDQGSFPPLRPGWFRRSTASGHWESEI